MRFLPGVLGLVALSPWASVLAESDCRAVRSALSDFHALGPAATKFCGSYLNIPETTSFYVTQTPTRCVGRLGVHLPLLLTLFPSILTLTVPTTTTVLDTSCPKTVKKRDVAVPTPLEQYPARVLSSACSRLSIVPTASTTLTGIASVAVVSLAPSCIVPLVDGTADLDCLNTDLDCVRHRRRHSHRVHRLRCGQPALRHQSS